MLAFLKGDDHYTKIFRMITTLKSADPSGVERVGENENTNYPRPTTKYQCQLPDTQYPNTLMPNTENIKMQKYLMIQKIKIPGCGRGPVALADGSNSMAMGRGLGHGLGLGDIAWGLGS